MSKHTHTVTTDVYDDGTTRTAIADAGGPIEPPPVITLPPDPNPTPPQDSTPIYIAASGTDTNGGMDPGDPVLTPGRAKEKAAEVIDAGGKPCFVMMRGGAYDGFGNLLFSLPGEAAWKARAAKGTEATPIAFVPYGAGALPVLNCGGTQGMGLTEFAAWVHIENIAFTGGTAIRVQSKRKMLSVLGCDMDNSATYVQPVGGGRFAGLDFSGNVVENAVVYGADRSGVFLDRCDDWTFDYNVLANNGHPADGGTTARSHGLYATGECSPCVRSIGGVYIENAGAGAQFRSAGAMADTFAGWNGSRGVNVGETLGAKTGLDGGFADVKNVVVYQEGGAAVAVGNLSSGTIDGLTAVSDNYALKLNSEHGTNNYGGLRVGLNAATVRNAAIKGKIRRDHDGWGAMGGEGIELDATCRHDGTVADQPTFADPEGKCVINTTDGQIVAPMPVLTDELRESILARKTTAADLIAKYGKH